MVLGKVWGLITGVGSRAWARITVMLGDRDLWLVAIFFLTFSNFLTNLVASITQASGNKVILAFQSLGITLGGSVGQMVNGLRIMTGQVPGEIGLLTWLSGLLTFLLGTSTIYWWYRGNSWFVDFMESTDPTIVHRSYMTAILLLSVMAFHDASQFYELFNLTETLGHQVQQAGGVIPTDVVNNATQHVTSGSADVNATASNLSTTVENAQQTQSLWAKILPDIL